MTCDTIVTRSFSKSHCLAGQRIGYALAHPEVIDLLDRVRDSYNVSRLSQVAALAAFEDVGYYDGLVQTIRATRDRFFDELTQRRGGHRTGARRSKIASLWREWTTSSPSPVR